MKKIITLLLLVLLSSSSIVSYAEVRPPEWQEFCPEIYLNSNYDNHVYYGYGLKEVLVGFTLVGIPFNFKNWHKQLNADANNYWTARRYSFGKELENCNADLNNRASCYMQIRGIEENKTALWQMNNNLKNNKNIDSNKPSIFKKLFFCFLLLVLSLWLFVYLGYFLFIMWPIILVYCIKNGKIPFISE